MKRSEWTVRVVGWGRVTAAAVVACTVGVGGVGLAGAPAGAGAGGEPAADVRFGPVDAGVVEARGADLRIMARVLERAVRPSGREVAPGFRMGIPLWVSGETEGGVKATYLEGFGALFTLQVGMPLVPAKSGAAAAVAGGKAVDSTWESARREVQGEPAAGGEVDAALVHDPEQVVRLRDQLIAALRQSTNIRHLAAGEFVAVVVEGPAAGAGDGGEEGEVGGQASGGGGGGGGAFTVSSSVGGVGGGGAGGAGGGAVFYEETGSGLGGGAPRGFRWGIGGPGSVGRYYSGLRSVGPGGEGYSRLTVRVRKADLDALAAGTLTAEAWAKAVSVHASSGAADGGMVRGRGPF